MRATSRQPDAMLDQAAPAALTWRYAAGLGLAEPMTALALARACFEGASRPMRLLLVTGWRILRLEGRARSDDVHVLGWPIAHAGPDVVLQRHSRWGLDATLLFTTAEATASFASGMTFSRDSARRLWILVAPMHKWVVRSVLTRAVRRG